MFLSGVHPDSPGFPLKTCGNDGLRISNLPDAASCGGMNPSVIQKPGTRRSIHLHLLQRHQRSGVAQRQHRRYGRRRERHRQRRRTQHAAGGDRIADEPGAGIALRAAGDHRSVTAQRSDLGHQPAQFFDPCADCAGKRKLGLENTATLRPFGDIPGIHAAFDRRIIAGVASTVTPKTSYPALANAADMDISYAMSVIAVTRNYFRPTVRRWSACSRAYVEGVAAMAHNKETTNRIPAKYLPAPRAGLSRRDLDFCAKLYGAHIAGRSARGSLAIGV